MEDFSFEEGFFFIWCAEYTIKTIEGVVTIIIWKDQNRMCEMGENLLKQIFGHPTWNKTFSFPN